MSFQVTKIEGCCGITVSHDAMSKSVQDTQQASIKITLRLSLITVIVIFYYFFFFSGKMNN